MSHFAKVVDGVVVEVIVADQDFIDNFADKTTGEWIQTSYNTRGNVHYGPDGEPDDGVALRKNYAGVGYTYDAALDAFIPPQPFPSWTLDSIAGLWDPPVPHPNDGNIYTWDEITQSWELVGEN